MYKGQFEEVEKILIRKDSLLIKNMYNNIATTKYCLFKLPFIYAIEGYKASIPERTNNFEHRESFISEHFKLRKRIEKLYPFAKSIKDISNKLIKDILNFKRENSKKFSINQNDNPMIPLEFESDVNDALIYINGLEIGKTPNETNLPFGYHNIVVYKKDHIPFIIYMNIKESSPRKLTVSLNDAQIKISYNPIDAQIYIDDENFDTLSLLFINLNSGVHTIKIKKSGYKDISKEIIVRPFKRIEQNYSLDFKTPKEAAIYSTVFPGLGQFYAEKETKGILFLTTEITALAGSFVFNSEMKRFNQKYKTYIQDYNNAKSTEEAIHARNNINHTYTDIETAETIRNIFIGSAIIIWIYNIFDAYYSMDMDHNSKRSEKTISYPVLFFSSESSGFNVIIKMPLSIYK
jgi:hypothetical protein